MSDHQTIIEAAFDKRANLSPRKVERNLRDAVFTTVDRLDKGELRVAEKRDGDWIVNEWVKKAVLLSFRIQDNRLMSGGYADYYDKVIPKYAPDNPPYDFESSGVRIVPPATARRGAYIAPGCVLMPSYVNIGAYVDTGTMVDTWATVGSCAQIGKKVHLSGGAGIGGVLEPVQAAPTIIEDNCFIGARSEIVEGVIVEEGAVISMGVYIGKSTKIYNRETGEIEFGRIPRGAVVVPGSLPARDGSHSLYCAVIIKQIDEQTRSKVEINELLRE